MSEPTRHKPRHAKPASHNPCVVLWRGFLNIRKASIISFSVMIIASPHAAIAQQNSDDAPISGIDAIPTDLPVHASTVRDPSQPVSLLPGTIPIIDSAEFVEEVPSLAAQYHQTISGTAPRAIKQAPKKPKVSSAPQKTPAVKRPAPVQTVTVAATPSLSVEKRIAWPGNGPVSDTTWRLSRHHQCANILGEFSYPLSGPGPIPPA